MTNPNDAIRGAILRKLNNIHQKARSPKKTAVGIKKLQSELRPEGYKQQQVASNLDYLVQKGWVAIVKSERTFTTPKGTTQSAEQITYKISDIGIDKLEDASIYKHPSISQNINITNINGVTIVGDGNVVNTEYGDLSEVITELRNALLESTDIADQEKLTLASDIDSLLSQLQKPELNTSVVKMLWSGIKDRLTKLGKTETLIKVAKFIAPLL